MKKTNTRNRIVSILLALVMLLTMLPTTAFAAGSAKTTTTDVEDRSALIDAMNDETTDIVRLNKDIDLTSEVDTIFYIEKSKTLDLSGHTITVPDGKVIKFWYYADADIKIMNSSNSSSAKIIGNHTGASTYYLLYGVMLGKTEKVNFVIDGVDFEVKNNNFTTIVNMEGGKKYENLIIKNSNVIGNQYLFWSGSAKKVYLESITLKGYDRSQYRQLSNTSSLTVNDVIDANAVIEYYSDAGVKATADRTATLDSINAYWGPITVKVGTPVVYTITFNSNDGTSVAPQNVNAGEKLTEPTPAPTRKGFTFDGWYEDSTFSKKFDFNTPITDSMTLYAKWTENKYTLTFDANGGTGSMTAKTDLTGEYTLPANEFTAPSGKQFKGWSLTTDGAIVTKVDMTENRTVYAIWKDAPVTEYDITVTDGKATVGAGTEITKAAEGTTVTLTANAAPTDMVFDKWEVISGSITLADANSATTTFTMPAGAVSVKATYTTYITVNLAAGEGSGTMEPIIIKNTYGYFSLTAPECTFTAPANKVFDKWQFSKDDSYLKPGDTKTIWSSADGATLTAIWKDAPVTEYDITVTDGKATVGAGTEITKAAEGTTVTLTAGAAPTGKVFDKWKVVSGGITLANANSATTTFIMPASAVRVKATYKNAPHTHTYNQETVKPEALKTPADCTRNAVYFKSCSCGAISTTDTFVAMDTALGHAYGSDWKYDSTNHWHECSRCHDKKYEAAHSAGEWIVDTPATATTAGTKHKECTVCKKVLETATIPATGSSHTHSYGTDWKYDNTNHWHECQCGDKADIAAHSASEWIIDTAATETAEGAKHKECTVCKKVLETATIPATGSSHTHSGVYVGMTYTAGNLIYQITSIDTATLGQSKVIGVVAAKKNKITKVTIPDRADYKGYRLNVTAVGDNAFKSMKKLKNVTFGSNVKVIGKNAFSNCKKLNKISFKNITTIGNNAFAGCKALKKLTIGNKVTVIGKNAFKDCSKLETVVIGKAVKTISSKAFIGDNKIKEITFKGKKLKTVKKDAFSNKAKKNIKSKKTKLKGNKKAIKLFKKKLKIK